MEQAISIELRYLIYCGALMLVLWIPYVLAEISVIGIGKSLTYPDERTMPTWARRCKAAHYNLVENIVPFAIAVLAGELLDIHTELTAACAMIFFWARVAHPFAQVLCIWGARSLTFTIGLTASLTYLIVILLAVT